MRRSANVVQAALALNAAEGRCAHGPSIKFGEDLLDDGVAAVVLLGLSERERAVGEHRVIPVGSGDKSALPLGDALGVEPACTRTAIRRPSTVRWRGGECGVVHLGDLSVGQLLAGRLVVDRVRVFDRRPEGRRRRCWRWPDRDRYGGRRPRTGRRGGVGARTTIMPVAPASREMLIASATRLAAPRRSRRMRPRNRAVATTGASGVLTAAGSPARAPTTSRPCFCASERRALLGAPATPAAAPSRHR